MNLLHTIVCVRNCGMGMHLTKTTTGSTAKKYIYFRLLWAELKLYIGKEKKKAEKILLWRPFAIDLVLVTSGCDSSSDNNNKRQQQ